MVTQLTLPAFLLSPPQHSPRFHATGGLGQVLSSRLWNGWVVTGRDSEAQWNVNLAAGLRGRWTFHGVHLQPTASRHTLALRKAARIKRTWPNTSTWAQGEVLALVQLLKQFGREETFELSCCIPCTSNIFSLELHLCTRQSSHFSFKDCLASLGGRLHVVHLC